MSKRTKNLSRQAKPHVWPESPDSSVKLSFLDINDQLSPSVQTTVLMNECAQKRKEKKS